MQQIERLALQRVMAREALAKLEALAEYFGVDDESQGQPQRFVTGWEVQEVVENPDLKIWEEKIAGLKSWIFDESPIA